MSMHIALVALLVKEDKKSRNVFHMRLEISNSSWNILEMN